MNNEWKFIDGYNNHYKINKDGVIVSVVKNKLEYIPQVYELLTKIDEALR